MNRICLPFFSGCLALHRTYVCLRVIYVRPCVCDFTEMDFMICVGVCAQCTNWYGAGTYAYVSKSIFKHFSNIKSSHSVTMARKHNCNRWWAEILFVPFVFAYKILPCFCSSSSCFCSFLLLCSCFRYSVFWFVSNISPSSAFFCSARHSFCSFDSCSNLCLFCALQRKKLFLIFLIYSVFLLLLLLFYDVFLRLRSRAWSEPIRYSPVECFFTIRLVFQP